MGNALVRPQYCLENGVTIAVDGDHKRDAEVVVVIARELGRIDSRVAS